MKGVRAQLAQPVELTCRTVAAALLKDAAKACRQLGVSDDPEALHDYRVAIRRLRSFVAAYRPYFPKEVGKKHRRRMGRLLSQTNSGRDREVQVRWLEGEMAKTSLPRQCHRGYGILLEGLGAVDEGIEASQLEKVRGAFFALYDKLESRLNAPRQSVRLDADGQVLSFAEATAAILLHDAGELRQELEAIRSVEDKKQGHRARLAAKRLRYVLEQVRSTVPGGRAAVGKLKDLQDILGDLRDLQHMEGRVEAMMEDAAVAWSRAMAASARADSGSATRTESAGSLDDCQALAAAMVRIRKGEIGMFRRLERRWLGPPAAVFFDRINAIVNHLSPGTVPEKSEPAKEVMSADLDEIVEGSPT